MNLDTYISSVLVAVSHLIMEVSQLKGFVELDSNLVFQNAFSCMAQMISST